jgi:hypothetical protein
MQLITITSYAFKKMQIRSINHNEGDQSFEEFASSMMKLV